VAHLEPSPIREHHSAVRSSFPIDLSKLVKIDNRRAMNTNKLLWVQFIAQVGNGIARHEPAAIHMEATVKRLRERRDADGGRRVEFGRELGVAPIEYVVKGKQRNPTG
jgi:hypothetical protein